jgi:hypothetical protein
MYITTLKINEEIENNIIKIVEIWCGAKLKEFDEDNNNFGDITKKSLQIDRILSKEFEFFKTPTYFFELLLNNKIDVSEIV